MTISFPFSFGWTPLTETLEGSELVYEDDHCGDATSLLISQFRDKPRLEAIICALTDGVQDLDDVVWQMLTERWLSTAIGVQLDGIGQILDLPRAGWGDETYRVLLGAQVLVLRSKGTWSDVFAILEAIGVTLAVVFVDNPSMAAMRVEVLEPFGPDITALDAYRLVLRAKPAGVRLTFIFVVSEAPAFEYADGTAEASDDEGYADSVSGLFGGELAGLLSSTEST